MKRFFFVPLLLFLLLCACSEAAAPLPTSTATPASTPQPVPASGSDIPQQETASEGLSPVFPPSERIPNYAPMVTDSADALEKVVVWDYVANVSAELSGDDALAYYEFLLAQETVGVPDPQHWDNPTVMLDAGYTVELYYTNGSCDRISAHSEGGSPYRFYRSFAESGKYGDPGYVYFQDDDTLLHMIQKSCEG